MVSHLVLSNFVYVFVCSVHTVSIIIERHNEFLNQLSKFIWLFSYPLQNVWTEHTFCVCDEGVIFTTLRLGFIFTWTLKMFIEVHVTRSFSVSHPPSQSALQWILDVQSWCFVWDKLLNIPIIIITTIIIVAVVVSMKNIYGSIHIFPALSQLKPQNCSQTENTVRSMLKCGRIQNITWFSLLLLLFAFSLAFVFVLHQGNFVCKFSKRKTVSLHRMEPVQIEIDSVAHK